MVRSLRQPFRQDLPANTASAPRNVRPFLFNSYSPKWEKPLGGPQVVRHDLCRAQQISVAPDALGAARDGTVRPQLGRVALVGHGWDALPLGRADAAPKMLLQRHRLSRKLDVECCHPSRFETVIDWMSKAYVQSGDTRLRSARCD